MAENLDGMHGEAPRHEPDATCSANPEVADAADGIRVATARPLIGYSAASIAKGGG